MKVRFILLNLIFFSMTSILSAQVETEAVILYLEGTVDITRDGEYLDWSEIDIGTVIDNYDMIETAGDGYLEIELRTPVSAAVTLKIHEDTTFYFDTKLIRDSTKTSFQLLKGSMGMKVQKLYDESELEVNVNNSVMGVRGTEFTISSMVDGSTLITTTEGRVSCKNDRGREWFSTPGTICETDGDNSYREVSVPADETEAYRDKWLDNRIEILKSNALVSIRHYAALYYRFYPRFGRSWQALEKKNDQFMKWSAYIRNNIKPSMSEAVLSKQSVSREIIELRSVLPVFHHTFYVMHELEKLYKDGYGKGSLDIDIDQKRVFDHYFRNYNETRRRLTKSLYYFRIYLEMGRNITGIDHYSEGLMDSIMSGSNMLMGPPTPNTPF